jgi:transcriptional regulator with XRE-family HTH domain
MDAIRDEMIDQVIARTLGEELKRARENLGLSQTELAARMPSDLHPKTLASYEQGVRQCTVVRLCEIARALNTSANDLLAKALLHAEIDLQTARMHVDLQALINDTRPELRLLRRWARTRLTVYPTTTVASLEGNAVQEMAVMLGTTITSLFDTLLNFAPNHDRSGPDGVTRQE